MSTSSSSRSTEALKRLGITHPILQAPMAGVATPALAAAVSNAGGLGGLGVGPMSHTAARDYILETQRLTDRPFVVNLFVHAPAVANPANEVSWIEALSPSFKEYGLTPPSQLREIYTTFNDYPEMLDVILETSPRIVSFHFGIPPKSTLDQMREKGMVLMASATSLAEAREIEKAGLDFIIAQGIEAGGHRGIFDPSAPDEALPTSDLLGVLVKKLTLPIIAAGGLMDGRDIARALDQGAVAAQLGTAWILCPETSADAGYRAALSSAAAEKTVLTKSISGRPARGLVNRLTELGREYEAKGGKLPDYPITFDAGKALHAGASKQGESGFGAYWAGAEARRARSMPAKELMETLLRELEEARGGKA